MTFVFKDNKIIGIWAYINGWEPFGKMKNSVEDMALNIVFKFPSVIKIQEKKMKELQDNHVFLFIGPQE